jgi:hypothetical protein
VRRIWGLVGSRQRNEAGRKTSTVPSFEKNVTAVAGLYLDPPDRATAHCIIKLAFVQHHEKPLIDALDRTEKEFSRTGTPLA